MRRLLVIILFARRVDLVFLLWRLDRFRRRVPFRVLLLVYRALRVTWHRVWRRGRILSLLVLRLCRHRRLLFTILRCVNPVRRLMVRLR